MKIIGRIQWWDQKYGKGVIEDIEENEYYFDKSVLLLKPSQRIRRNQIVMFRLNKAIKEISSAHKVVILTITKKATLKFYFEKQIQKDVTN